MLRRTILAALLCLAPAGAALATCPSQEAQATCAEGYAWDAATRACVQQVTG